MRRLLVFLLLISLLAPAAPALAVSTTDRIIADCTDDGVLEGQYKTKDLQRAYKKVPADAQEYTDCESAIQYQIAQNRRRPHRGKHGRGSGSASGSSSNGHSGFTPVSSANAAASLSSATPAELKAIGAAQRDGGKPVRLRDVAGRALPPAPLGVVHPADLRRAAATTSQLPAPLMAAGILVVLAALGAAGPWVKRHVVARRSDQ